MPVDHLLGRKAEGHAWRFFRAGGFDQVRLDRGADLCALDQLDQKLWMALSCPTRGLEFDTATLDLIDTDKDGRIRAPEIIAATKWACANLKDPNELVHGGSSLALAAINDATAEGKQLLASAKQILINLGKPQATAISVEDTANPTKIFVQTRLNGDGVIPADTPEDPALQAVIGDIIVCLGSEPDRSGRPGVTQAKVEQFFKELTAYSEWWRKAETDRANVLPLGEATSAAAEALRGLRTKVDDYFARCRLAAFDPRATQALNRQESEYLELAAKDLTISMSEIAAFPLARVEPCRAMPLVDGVNPGWAAAVETLRTQVVRPFLGDKTALTEPEWQQVTTKFAPFETWQAAKAGTVVEKLGLGRVREILASQAKAALSSLIAQDKALEPEANAIAAVDRLVRYHRDLFALLNNYVNFRDFYARGAWAIFQAGTLYLDQRSCELCVRVEDMARHGSMAHLSYTYLAYCDLVRKATGETMTIAAAFTNGDSDNLMVGRNGLFYDRKGQDWDATIVKIVDNPISIRQAFWAPYKRFTRWVEDQIAKRAAAADVATNEKLIGAATRLEQASEVKIAQPPRKMDVGVVAALGVAAGALATAFSALLAWLSGTPPYLIPFYVALIMLLISLPSMVLAALKLRQRNLGPILDANGWAVNARAKINIPFGASLTQVRKLPPGSHRDLVDPYRQSRHWRAWVPAIVIVAGALWALWYFGEIERIWPGAPLPESGYVRRQKAAKAANTQPAQVEGGMTAQTAPATRP